MTVWKHGRFKCVRGSSVCLGGIQFNDFQVKYTRPLKENNWISATRTDALFTLTPKLDHRACGVCMCGPGMNNGFSKSHDNAEKRIQLWMCQINLLQIFSKSFDGTVRFGSVFRLFRPGYHSNSFLSLGQCQIDIVNIMKFIAASFGLCPSKYNYKIFRW